MTKQTVEAPLRGHDEAKGLWEYIRGAPLPVIMTAPLVYVCIFPFALLDLFVALYQAVCFPINGIAKVRRRDYIVFDRARLPYLNAIEKFGCVYCSYANGLLAYVAEIAARTEQHFCPIKHDATIPAPHSRYPSFVPFGDATAYRIRVDERASVRLLARRKSRGA